MLRRTLTVGLVAAVVLAAPGPAAYATGAPIVRGLPAAARFVATPVVLPALSLRTSVAPGLLLAPALSPSAPVLSAPVVIIPVTPAAPAPAVSIEPLLETLTAAAEAPAPDPARSAESESTAGAARFDLAAPRAETDAAPVAPDPGPAPKSGKVKLPRTVWGTIIGHGMLTVFGIELHVISQPFLVTQTLGQSMTTMGIVRNVHSGAYSLTNLLPIGYLVDKTDFRALFIGTSLARALMMGAIPALWLTGNLTIAALLIIVALNPLFQTTMVVAERSAIMAAVGKDEKMNKEATATLGKWEALAGMFMPLLAGWALGALVTSYGLGGYAMAYGIYSVMLLLAVPMYWYMVRDPRDPKDLGWDGFRRFGVESAKFLFAIVKAVVKLPYTLARALWRYFADRRAGAPAQDPASAAGLKERLARWFDQHESTKGLAYILRNRTLSILMMIGAIEAFLMEALPMVVLPNYIIDVVGTAPTGVPFIGVLLATSGGILGMMFSAEYMGRFVSSWYMEGERGDKLIAKWGHGRFYRAAAVSSLLIWLMWVVPTFMAAGSFWISLLTVVGVMGVMQFFHAPVHIVMASVKRAEIPDEMLGRVESSFDMVDLGLAAMGALLAGLLLDFTSITTAMGLIAVAVTVTALLQWLAPRLLFPDGKRPAPKS